MKTKITKESRNLLIALLLGDGTISNNNVFKLSHGYKQKEYLEWKIQKLKDHGLKNNGLKEYISNSGYNKGDKVYYTQLSIIPFIKLLRKIVYKNKKNYCKRQLLNRLNPLGIAIWYMDDGHINIRKTKDKIHGFYIKISTCISKEDNQVIIDYFKEVWNISFYTFSEGKGTYSLCCGTTEGLKFIKLIKPYVESCPSMLYKIQYDLSQRRDSLSRVNNSKHYTPKGEDIV